MFGKLRPYLAKALMANFAGRCSGEFLILRPKEFYNKYLLYLFLSDGFIKTVNSSTYGAKMPRAEWSFIGNMLVPVPEYEEQKMIVELLDKEVDHVHNTRKKVEKQLHSIEEYKRNFVTQLITGKLA